MLQSASVSGEQDRTKKELSCPKCGSRDVRGSYADGFWAFVCSKFGRWPFRCRSCRLQFYRRVPRPSELLLASSSGGIERKRQTNPS